MSRIQDNYWVISGLHLIKEDVGLAVKIFCPNIMGEYILRHTTTKKIREGKKKDDKRYKQYPAVSGKES